MLQPRDIKRVRQEKLNALTAIALHRQQVKKLQKWNQAIELLTIAVPVLYLTPRILAKGTVLASLVNNFGELLAAFLFFLAILKLNYRWQDSEVRHNTMSSRNSDIIHEADRLLNSATANREVVEQWLNRIKDINAEDGLLLPNVKDIDKHRAYREALKALEPSANSTVCPVCGANPWHYTPGKCEACGGTPEA